MRPAIRKEPKGTVLIISPFNFPIMLLLGHLVCLTYYPWNLTPTLAASRLVP
jgi:hypothetical protein